MTCFLIIVAVLACMGVWAGTKEACEVEAQQAYDVGFRLGRIQGRREARDLQQGGQA